MNAGAAAEFALHLKLLGGFQLTYQGRAVPGFHQLRLQSLLASLVLSRGTPLSRQQLAFRLWPDSNESQARTNLRHLLHILRSILPEQETYLTITFEQVEWNLSAPTYIDVIEFEAAARQKQSIESLLIAADLYKGDLLPDCYEEWIVPERSRLQAAYHACLDDLIQIQAAHHNFSNALSAAQTLLQCDPLNEITYTRMMELHAVMGDRAGVVRVYEMCAAVLKKELGIKPCPETQAAYQDWVNFSPEAPSHNLLGNILNLSPSGTNNKNLTTPLDSLIGRSEDQHKVIELLKGHRLLTLTGFGGVGKTRLAQEVASEISKTKKAPLELEGVWWIDLAPISDPHLLYQAVAASLQLPEQANRSVSDSLIDILANRHLLVVIDNCEHLLEAAAQFILMLLKGCPSIRVLATSRVSLHISGEVVFPIKPLSVISQGEEALSESEMLFCDRAALSNPLFILRPEYRQAVRSLCRRLDGIPLAIELAAARTRVLTPPEIASRLDDAFHLLVQKRQGVLPRHQTLRATLDWSHNLLTRPEQRFLHRISIFSGSFSLSAAEAITAYESRSPDQAQGLRSQDSVLDLLAGLIEHSLISVEETSFESRYRLHEVTRQYAAEKLSASGEEHALRASYLDYYACLAGRAEVEIIGKDLIPWLRKIDHEMDCLRIAIEWALQSDAQNDIAAGMRMVGELWMYWFIRGRFEEGLAWAVRALEAAEGQTIAPGVSGKVFTTAASLTLFQGLVEQGDKYTQASLEKCQQAGDPIGVAIALHHLGMVARMQGNHHLAMAYYQEGLRLTRQFGNHFWENCLLIDLGVLAEDGSDYPGAIFWYLESLEIARSTQNAFNLVYALLNLAYTATQQNNLQKAKEYNLECLTLARELEDPRVLASALGTNGKIAARQGQLDEAEAAWKSSLKTYTDIRDRENILHTLEDLATIAAQRGELHRAAILFGASQAARERLKLDSSNARIQQFEALIQSLRTDAGQTDFATAYHTGLNFNLDQAVDFILEAQKPIE